jgi:hypothetical protein
LSQHHPWQQPLAGEPTAEQPRHGGPLLCCCSVPHSPLPSRYMVQTAVFNCCRCCQCWQLAASTWRCAHTPCSCRYQTYHPSAAAQAQQQHLPQLQVHWHTGMYRVPLPKGAGCSPHGWCCCQAGQRWPPPCSHTCRRPSPCRYRLGRALGGGGVCMSSSFAVYNTVHAALGRTGIDWSKHHPLVPHLQLSQPGSPSCSHPAAPQALAATVTVLAASPAGPQVGTAAALRAAHAGSPARACQLPPVACCPLHRHATAMHAGARACLQRLSTRHSSHAGKTL